MTVRWVARLPRQRRECLSSLRLRPRVEALSLGEEVVIRGRDEELPKAIRVLPARLYTALDDDQLVPCGRRAPTWRMPVGAWAPLATWLQVELPTAAFDAERPRPAPLRLRRGASPAEPSVLLCSLEDWLSYASSAPELRLRRWRFAADRSGRVVVQGLPLPPLPGRRFVESAGVAVEAGWTWQPPLDAEVVARAVGVPPGGIGLLPHDGPPEAVAAEQFSPALRSAVRLTAAAHADGLDRDEEASDGG